MADFSNTDVIVKSDIKRYKKNSSASWLVYLSIAFLILYFLILYANSVSSRNAQFADGEKVLGSTFFYSYIFGIDVILNLCVLLFGFYTAVKIGGYSKSFCYVSYVLAAIQIARIFIIPMCYLNVYTSDGNSMLDSYDFTWLVVMLVLSAACFISGGVLGQIRTTQREAFQKALDNDEIDLESALKDENDVLTKDESSVDILGEDLDSGKIVADDTSDEALLEAETTSVGGE
ncbi:MAG: hypothetical protein LUD72_11525 [Bacteroidales bacterium]|nr:hypothetical protein [Bacteroidales bacterium]